MTPPLPSDGNGHPSDTSVENNSVSRHPTVAARSSTPGRGITNIRSGIIGLLAGFFGGLVGLGGGVVMVPLLTGWAQLGQHRAHATSLVAVVFTGVLGGAAYATGGEVAWRTAAIIAAASTTLALISASYSHRISAQRLKQAFGALLIIVAVLLPVGSNIVGGGISGTWQMPAAILLGGFAGVLTGLLGVGGGSLVVPLLVLVFGFDQHLAQGTSLAIMIPAGIAGALVHLRKRTIDLSILPGLIIGVAVGAFVGGRIALGIPGLPLQLFFAALLIWTGARYLKPRGAASTNAST